MTCNEMKVDSNPNESFTSGKDVDSSNQGERVLNTKSDLTEESHHVRTKTIYSSNNQNMQTKQVHKQATYGAYDPSSREEETNQINVQSRTGTVNPSIWPRNKTSKPSVNPIIGDVPNMTCNEMTTESNPNKSFTSGKDVDSRYQGERM